MRIDNSRENIKLLIGTTNTFKLDFLVKCLKDLPIETLSLADLSLTTFVEEKGNSTEENALIKAKAYYSLSNIYTLSSDSGLYFEGLPKKYQPGVRVKRKVEEQSKNMSIDETEMLDYYVKVLQEINKPVKGLWLVGLALALTKSRVVSTTISISTTFVKQISKTIVPGMPLLSLQIDADGNYLSEDIENSRIVKKLIYDIHQFVKVGLVQIEE